MKSIPPEQLQQPEEVKVDVDDAQIEEQKDDAFKNRDESDLAHPKK
ncbi:MAG: hypothetical protein ABSB35_30190 [Bryobacteraceae bacterium]